MRSPVHPAIMGWMLRPRPTGLHRVAAGYLCVAAATAGAVIIIAVFHHAADTCVVDGFGCLGLIFRGIAAGTTVGLAILFGSAILVRLGGLYVLAVAGFGLAALTVAVLLGRAGVAPLPVAIVLLAGTPALAAWSTRPVPEPRFPSAAIDARASRTPTAVADPGAIRGPGANPRSGAAPRTGRALRLPQTLTR
ncbi:hypothetical protein [Microlunatus soli]|uniref:Uncharacterized protein n=1 Tax=Microlunatus soli TaxID=630515 RepID=A0A1H1QXE3_9ACTN|nr:hypothetical protein [Microlunatus soli]SDS27955.1 hypothetical protein SAMN04489812_1422 [Microlunatus soli]